MHRSRSVSADHNGSNSASSSASSPERTVYDDNDFFTVQRNDSQSSIGVDTIQDLNMSSPSSEDQHALSPISRLPPELLIYVFSKITSSMDLRSCVLVSKTWSQNCVDLLWHRPLCNTWKNLLNVVSSVRNPKSYFSYNNLVKRLNLSTLSEQISDGTVQPFIQCNRIERLTLTSCVKLTDHGVISLIDGSRGLLALDITGLESVTDHTLLAVSENCLRLQGLNITDCSRVTDESLVAVAEACRYLKRVGRLKSTFDQCLLKRWQLKLNNCSCITDESVLAVAYNCPSMLEIDLHNCRQITDESITALLSNGRQLRELRVGHCVLISDRAFLDIPVQLTFESLRILDLTACVQLHDEAVEKIIDTSPRLRNLVLAKCREITDRSVQAITKLGKNLHYIHLGHCAQISDHAVIQLVKSCNRIRYIDLACCHRLTDLSVKQLATLPKLRRIGLVKCNSITDKSILALAKANLEPRSKPQGPSFLERVHLSYCVHLTLQGIHALLNHCPKLTHLSLTGVQAFFLRDDLINFCREAPPGMSTRSINEDHPLERDDEPLIPKINQEFTDHQRNVFCVFSGDGVNRLRKYLNEDPVATYEPEGIMFDDQDGEAEADQTVQMAGMMNATGLGPDDEDMEDDVDVGDGSQYGGEPDV